MYDSEELGLGSKTDRPVRSWGSTVGLSCEPLKVHETCDVHPISLGPYDGDDEDGRNSDGQ